MSSLSLMNQSISVYQRSSYDSHGREVVGSATTVVARIQQKTRNVFMANRELVTILATAYVPPGTTVSIDDKVSFASQTMKVFSKYEVPDGSGNVDHIKLELIRWQ